MMGPECNNQLQNHHNIYHHLHHENNNKSTIFLPMLCSRPSIINQVHGSLQKRPSSSSDPLSPKISCIGQVKRKNNKVKAVVFPNPPKLITTTTTTSNTKHTNHNHNIHRRNNSHSHSHDVISGVKYSKLKKFFSSRNLAAEERVHVAASGGGGVSIVDLDPPLPVVKRRPIDVEAQGEEVVESLWKRRSGGATLKGLQIRHSHHPCHHLQPTTV